jgi:hypothetical protein
VEKHRLPVREKLILSSDSWRKDTVETDMKELEEEKISNSFCTS